MHQTTPPTQTITKGGQGGRTNNETGRTEGGQWVARPTPTAALTDQLGQSRTDAAALSAYSTAAELRQWLRARSPPWDWGVPTSQIRHPKNTYVSNRSIMIPSDIYEESSSLDMIDNPMDNPT